MAAAIWRWGKPRARAGAAALRGEGAGELWGATWSPLLHAQGICPRSPVRTRRTMLWRWAGPNGPEEKGERAVSPGGCRWAFGLPSPFFFFSFLFFFCRGFVTAGVTRG